MNRAGIYQAIGVRPFINCCGTRTVHGGTLMLPCVRQAMQEASAALVNIDELMEGVGDRLAELTGAERAIVTSGGAAALCVATAAALTGGDPERLQRLPRLDGPKDRVVMLKSGRFTYDQAIRAVGARIVEVGAADMAAALEDKRVGLVALLGTDPAVDPALPAIVDRASTRDIPVLVDAASEHLRNPNPYLQAGVSMVAYSGGKYLRGPQSSGLLLGQARWVRAAWTGAAPHHAFARMMKVGKEEIMGLLAAVEYWAAERDDKAEYRVMVDQLTRIAARVGRLPGVEAEVLERKEEKSPTPRLLVTWPAGGPHGLELRDRLLEGTPRIMLDDRGATENSIFILPFSLQEGEGEAVGQAIAAQLGKAASPATEDEARADADAGAPADVSGHWQVEITLHAGPVRQTLHIEQEGERLSGRHRTAYWENDAVGRMEGNRLRLAAEHPYEGTSLVYTFEGIFEGEAADGRLEGSVELGTEGQSAPGPLNRREFGSYRWTAERMAED